MSFLIFLSYIYLSDYGAPLREIARRQAGQRHRLKFQAYWLVLRQFGGLIRLIISGQCGKHVKVAHLI